MIREVHFNSALYARITLAMHQGGCAALPPLLRTLSVSQFRTAGYMLGERVAMEITPSQFWELFRTLVQTDNRAFLVTMLHALSARMKSGDVGLSDDGFLSLVPVLSDVDAQKFLRHVLPLLQQPQDVSRLMDLLGVEGNVPRIRLLLSIGTMPCAFVLFRTLRYVEHDHALLVRVAASLKRQGDPLSFNLASIMREFFGLEELKGTFSLNLKPWQLDRMENSYEAFSQALRF